MANGRSVAPARKTLAVVLGTVAAFVIFYGVGRGSWPTAAIGAALLILAISLVAFNALGGGTHSWLAGSAHVLNASDPPANSTYGRCEMQIVVDAVGMPAASVKIRDARVPVAKWPVAGTVLPIEVAVDDPRHVRVQWDDMPTHAEAAAEEQAYAYETASAGLLRPEEQFAAYEAAAADGLLSEDIFDDTPYDRTRRAPDPAARPDDLDDADDLDALARATAPADPAPEPEPAPDAVDPSGDVTRARERTTGGGEPEPTPERDVRERDVRERDVRERDVREGAGREGAGRDDRDGAGPGSGPAPGEDAAGDEPGTEPDQPRLPARRLPPDEPREPVIVTDTPQGPVVEGSIVERGRGSQGSGEGGATTHGPSFGSTPLPRRKPRPYKPRDPQGRRAATAASTAATAATATATTATASATAGAGAGAGAFGAAATAGATVGTATTAVPTPVDAGHRDVPPAPDSTTGNDGEPAPILTPYPSARPGPTGPIHGVGITVLVTDLERSIAFYRDMLGFFEIDGGDGNAVLASGDTRLVLRVIPEVAAVNRRVVHLNLEVGDVEATYHDLKEKGVRFTYAPRPVNKGELLELWAAAFHDPDGHGIAITQWRTRPHE